MFISEYFCVLLPTLFLEVELLDQCEDAKGPWFGELPEGRVWVCFVMKSGHPHCCVSVIGKCTGPGTLQNACRIHTKQLGKKVDALCELISRWS